jgi:hypothetical protein
MSVIVRGKRYLVLAAALLLPITSGAEKPEDKGNAGGKALEHRSERAVERANSQQQEDATRGEDRAEEVREKAESSGDEAAKPGKKAKKEAKKAEQQVKVKGKKSSEEADDYAEPSAKQPRGEAVGFWERWFGGRSEDNQSDKASD